jgi:membrane fusion protein (multidrug efflux system)
MYVSLMAHLGQQNNVYLVPQQALLRDTQGGYLLVAGQDNKVARKDVEANSSLGNDWIVTKGLSEGDQVIVTGVQAVHEGSQVTTAPWQPPPEPSAAASGVQPASETKTAQ